MATIYDVAKKAGVSVGTVSNVINGKTSVSPDLRQRVQAAMQSTGYVPNHFARSLAKGRTNNIGVLYPFNPNHLPGTNYLEFVSHLVTYAQEYEQQVVLYPTISPDSSMVNLMRIMRSRQVRGFILFEVEMLDQRVEFLREKNFPFVMVGRCEHNDGLNYVDADVDQIIADTVKHLAENGYRRVAHLGRKSFIGVDYRIHTELSRRCNEAGLQFDQSLCLRSTWEKKERRELINYFLNRHEEFDAILITEAVVRFQFVREALRAGLRIPDDLAVIGYMGTYLDDLSHPSISAFDVQAQKLVESAVKILVDSNREGDPQQVLVPGRLIPRESTRKKSNNHED